MKQFVIALCFTMFTGSLLAQKIQPVPVWLKTAIFYQIYPQSFQDTNNDGIGDINGITHRLDYIKWLGCNAIWINPCFESPFFDAGYDVTDYYKVAPRYGTNQDLENLFKEAHKRNIKVCLDLVAGHTSDQHPWFKASQQQTLNEFSDRYIWTNDSTLKPEKFVAGKFERNGTYRKNFFECQPALNYGYGKPNPDNPWEQAVTAEGPQKTKSELIRIIDFWMDKGADGFRVDMAGSLVKNDPDLVATNKLWKDIRSHFQSKYADGILIAEWGDPAKSIKANFMMDFLIHLRNSGYSSMFFNKEGVYRHDTCYFSSQGNGSPVNFINLYNQQLKEVVAGKGYLCLPTSNHDFQRPASGDRNTIEQLKAAMVFFLTLPSVPLVYYGDEIGMKYISGLPNKEGSVLSKGNRAGTRTPMQWDKTKGAGFSSADPEKFYLPLDSSLIRPDVATQLADTNSLLHFTRKLLTLRSSSKALKTEGTIQFYNTAEHTYPLVYQRKFKNETFLIVINPSAKEQAIQIKSDKNVKKVNPTLIDGVELNTDKSKGLTITAKTYGYGIFKLN
ncbi:alpha-amylase family glycosyl hydrolase [Solitalea lacus]|uniref:alpha-amylase family glycosyl hydrolase n=1 Tax=Solitalea lacus TaxID=2911172 RepID=UPI001EDBEF7A|nr:alpha-amylase family glycosyl hydrolase [Solitalea lacus]UKJ07775.1 alpha-glucosidase C-terminal domain-containing protein [Solitalea lacus]